MADIPALEEAAGRPVKQPAAVDPVGSVSPETACGISVSGVDCPVDFLPSPTCVYRDSVTPKKLAALLLLIENARNNCQSSARC